jgi:preprotein translocase subunit SecA
MTTWLPANDRLERSLDRVVENARRTIDQQADLSTEALRRAAAEIPHLADANLRLARGLAIFVAAVRRTLAWTPYDVQLRAAAAMACGLATEMRTGEGKTLAVAAAATALALAGRRVHVATVNPYLAERDFAQFAPTAELSGVSIGLLGDRMTETENRAVYEKSIVYGTGYGFGFDYLRQCLARHRAFCAKPGERVRNRLRRAAVDGPFAPVRDVVIVDEMDSVLLDEATVPLVLNQQADRSIDDAPATAAAALLAEQLRLGEHFSIDPGRRQVVLGLPALRSIAERLPPDVRPRLRRPWPQYVEDGLTVLHVLRRDVDYIVADRRIWLVDLTTGRIQPDRRWSEGVQHAIEQREELPYSAPSIEAGKVTRRRFFKLYAMLGGTSGTLVEAAEELGATYRLKTCVVPPRLPSQLVEWPTLAFVDSPSRDRAAVDEAVRVRASGRPVLIGCRTIAAGRAISERLAAAGIEHQVLDGTQSAAEARIIAEAGRSGSLLVATNMAGRGTDIRLDAAALQAGGLHVVGLEVQDSARVDRQLLGRAARQGEPGSGRFYLSADDALWQTDSRLVDRLRRAADPSGTLASDVAAEIARHRRRLELSARRRRLEAAVHDARLAEIMAALEQPS